jgi:hypothetical protein
MQTESSVYEALLSGFISELERKASRIEKQEELSDSDVIELAALECLLERLDGLEGYAPRS